MQITSDPPGDSSESMRADFHKLGFVQPKVDLNTELLNELSELCEGKVRDGFSLDEKYALSLDLRPDAANHPLISDFIESNKLLHLAQSVSGRKLSLATVQFRVSLPGPKSYLSWHRDVHYYNGRESAGRFPPPIKFNFYPVVRNGFVGETLKVVAGSHLRVFRNRYIDRINTLPLFASPQSVRTDNETGLLFNTQLFHGVLPSNAPSPRIIVSFW